MDAADFLAVDFQRPQHCRRTITDSEQELPVVVAVIAIAIARLTAGGGAVVEKPVAGEITTGEDVVTLSFALFPHDVEDVQWHGVQH